jgi:NTE family protein
MAEKSALVLSAGGMFGAYQAGVWRILSEHFRPDVVIGISAGALNGRAIAGECAPDELIERWMDPHTADVMQFRVPLNPLNGFLNPGPLQQLLAELCARYPVRIPFATVVVDALRLKARLMCSPEMTARHLEAACAIPGGFPPVRLDGRFYADGGLLGAMPLWPAVDLGATRVIGVNCLAMAPSRLLRAGVRIVGACSRAINHDTRAESQSPFELTVITPREPLGGLRDAIHWNRDNVRRWIELGEKDALACARKLSFSPR